MFETGRRVQWHRAEAEWQRWGEQTEIKKAELVRTWRACGTMKRAWLKLGNNCENAKRFGHMSYANRTAERYRRMEDDLASRARKHGLGDFLLDTEKPLWKTLDALRKKNDVTFNKLGEVVVNVPVEGANDPDLFYPKVINGAEGDFCIDVEDDDRDDKEDSHHGTGEE